MITCFANVRVMPVVFGVVFGFLAAGCEIESLDDPTANTTTQNDSGSSSSGSTGTSSSTADSDSSTTNTAPAVINDDPNCRIKIRYQARDIRNEGQVTYINRVVTCNPFDAANPVCVQYNDTVLGEVTVWKDTSHKGSWSGTLPSDRGIDIIVVWYE